jgi:tellurite resistance protein
LATVPHSREEGADYAQEAPRVKERYAAKRGLNGEGAMRGVRIPAVPASFFAIILGLVGLGGCWRLASRLWTLPAQVGETIMLVAAAIWAILTLLYLAKWVWLRADALAEFRHPVLCCFIALVPISTALVGAALLPYQQHEVATALAAIGIVGQIVFAAYRTGQLWKGGRDPSTTTPALYLPTGAGGFVSAVVLSAFGLPDWGIPFFASGLLSSLAVDSVIIHRMYTAPEMAPAIRPIMGIQLAPPAVGCAAYLAVTSGPPDLVVQVLIGYALLQALLLIRLLPWIARAGFSAGFWAFTFGVSALAFDMMRFAERGGHGPIAAAAPYAFGAANLIIGAIALGTLWLLVRGKLLPPRLISAPST